MGFFSKKKKESFDDLADKSMNADLHDNLGLNEKSPFDDRKDPYKPEGFSNFQNAQQQPIDKREIELLNSKLETIKAILAAMDQRLANIEKAAGIDQKQRLW